MHAASEEGESKLLTVRQAESEFKPHRTFVGNLDFKKGSVVGGTHWHCTCIIINDHVKSEYERSDSAGHCVAIRLLHVNVNTLIGHALYKMAGSGVLAWYTTRREGIPD